MAKLSEKAKRFVRSHIFRTAVFAAVLFGTVFFPLVYAYPSADGEQRKIIIIFVVFSYAFETLALIMIAHYFVYVRLTIAANRLNGMARGNVMPQYKKSSVDATAADVLSAVNATASEYARLEQVRKNFVANASHELRSPLTSIQGFLQAVTDGTVAQSERDQYVKIALSETKRLNSLINSMLDLSRLDSGKNPLVFSKFNINDVINEVASRFEPSLIKKALQLNVDFSKQNCYVYADKDKIVQVLTNLVDNAIKYSSAYSSIVITTTTHENKAYISVRDFGYGISKKDQMLIWDQFYMTDRSRTPIKTKGSGLGLSIVKKIIDEHGEVIWVESSRGAGATFIFTLTMFDPSKHSVAAGKIISSPEEQTESDGAAKKDTRS